MTPKASRTIRASIFTLLVFSPVMFLVACDQQEAPLNKTALCTTDTECEALTGQDLDLTVIPLNQ